VAELTPEKARKILRDGKVNGKPLTAKQKRYFGLIAGKGKKKKNNPHHRKMKKYA